MIQDLSLESLHDLRSHRYLRKSRGTLKRDVNMEYEPTSRNKYENDSICTIENDNDHSGVNRVSSNFELLPSVPIHLYKSIYIALIPFQMICN